MNPCARVVLVYHGGSRVITLTTERKLASSCVQADDGDRSTRRKSRCTDDFESTAKKNIRKIRKIKFLKRGDESLVARRQRGNTTRTPRGGWRGNEWRAALGPVSWWEVNPRWEEHGRSEGSRREPSEGLRIQQRRRGRRRRRACRPHARNVSSFVRFSVSTIRLISFFSVFVLYIYVCENTNHYGSIFIATFTCLPFKLLVGNISTVLQLYRI